MKLDGYFFGGTQCFDNITNMTFLVYQDYQQNMTLYGAENPVNLRGQINTVAGLITNASNVGVNCTGALLNAWLYSNQRLSLFGTFSNTIAAFFQNLLSQVISINNIY